MSTRFTLIAHAATEAQRTATFPTDEPVTARERERLASHGWRAPRATQVLSAPEVRAQETAQLLGIEPMVAEALRDCDYGRWRGRTMDSVQEEDPEGLMAWLTASDAAPHGGESVEQLIARAGRWLDANTAQQHTVAVTHPAWIRAAIVHALRLPPQLFWRFDIAPLTLTDLRRSGALWTIRCTGSALLQVEQDTVNSILKARDDIAMTACHPAAVLCCPSNIPGAREGITGKPGRVRRDLPTATRKPGTSAHVPAGHSK